MDIVLEYKLALAAGIAIVALSWLITRKRQLDDRQQPQPDQELE
jgi:hypothetical protein